MFLILKYKEDKSLLCILIEFILILTDNDISFDVV